jgi:hypothetical protein
MTDDFTLEIPAALAPGEYSIIAGMYGVKDGARLPVSGEPLRQLRGAGDHLLIAPVMVGAE